MDHLQEASRFLLGIVNDLLSASTLQHGELVLFPAPVSLSSLLIFITEVLRPKAEEKKLAFRLVIEQGLDRPVMVDKQRISQIFYNIIGNAIKFTERGFVEVHLGMNDVNKQVLVSVKDSGRGIPANKLTEIFQPFSRVNQPGQLVEGTGLGLAIAQQLVQRMGGDITVSSVENKGTVFNITFPLAFATEMVQSAGDKREPVICEAQHYPQRVLIVEDNRMNQIVITKTLAKQWHKMEAVLAADGKTALSILHEAPPFDLIFMDIQLPDMDGYEITSLIRAGFNGRYQQTPLLR
ncbi:MAG: ATP-binding protein [Saprospiraceae bacterium]